MGKRSNRDAKFIIECEGMDYAVMHYCSGADFKDPETARLWTEAGEALRRLEQHLWPEKKQSKERKGK